MGTKQAVPARVTHVICMLKLSVLRDTRPGSPCNVAEIARSARGSAVLPVVTNSEPCRSVTIRDAESVMKSLPVTGLYDDATTSSCLTNSHASVSRDEGR